MRSYKGKFDPQNPKKYFGTLPIIFRSKLEFMVMMWCDHSSNIVKWGSESVVVPYLSEADNRVHRYYIDFVIEFISGEKYLIEIKPKSQTHSPKMNKNGTITDRYIREVFEFSKNKSKWAAAKEFAEKTGFKFEVWTEETLEKLGIYKS